MKHSISNIKNLFSTVITNMVSETYATEAEDYDSGFKVK